MSWAAVTDTRPRRVGCSSAGAGAMNRRGRSPDGGRPLTRDLEVTGRLIVRLWAASDSPDTDFTAKLIDVYPPSADFPGGIELNIGDSIVRARYRNGPGRAEMLQPGKPYEFTIEMYPT